MSRPSGTSTCSDEPPVDLPQPTVRRTRARARASAGRGRASCSRGTSSSSTCHAAAGPSPRRLEEPPGQRVQDAGRLGHRRATGPHWSLPARTCTVSASSATAARSDVRSSEVAAAVVEHEQEPPGQAARTRGPPAAAGRAQRRPDAGRRGHRRGRDSGDTITLRTSSCDDGRQQPGRPDAGHEAPGEARRRGAAPSGAGRSPGWSGAGRRRRTRSASSTQRAAAPASAAPRRRAAAAPGRRRRRATAASRRGSGPAGPWSLLPPSGSRVRLVLVEHRHRMAQRASGLC